MSNLDRNHPLNNRTKSSKEIQHEVEVFARVAAIFSDRFEADVIRLILEECDWKENEAIEKLCELAEEDVEVKPQTESISFDIIACELLESGNDTPPEEVDTNTDMPPTRTESAPILALSDSVNTKGLTYDYQSFARAFDLPWATGHSMETEPELTDINLTLSGNSQLPISGQWSSAASDLPTDKHTVSSPLDLHTSTERVDKKIPTHSVQQLPTSGKELDQTNRNLDNDSKVDSVSSFEGKSVHYQRGSLTDIPLSLAGITTSTDTADGGGLFQGFPAEFKSVGSRTETMMGLSADAPEFRPSYSLGQHVPNWPSPPGSVPHFYTPKYPEYSSPMQSVPSTRIHTRGGFSPSGQSESPMTRMFSMRPQQSLPQSQFWPAQSKNVSLNRFRGQNLYQSQPLPPLVFGTGAQSSGYSAATTASQGTKTSHHSSSSSSPAESCPNSPTGSVSNMQSPVVERITQYGRDRVKVLVLMRGLPGSGKSYLARQMQGNGQVFSTDDYFMQGDVYNFSHDKLPQAHDWNKRRVQKALNEGITPVIVDNTNTELWEMMPYADMAYIRGYAIEIAEPDTPWKFQPKRLAKCNAHGVPIDAIKRMKDRYENVDTATLMAWVQKKRQNEFPKPAAKGIPMNKKSHSCPVLQDKQAVPSPGQKTTQRQSNPPTPAKSKSAGVKPRKKSKKEFINIRDHCFKLQNEGARHDEIDAMIFMANLTSNEVKEIKDYLHLYQNNYSDKSDITAKTNHPNVDFLNKTSSNDKSSSKEKIQISSNDLSERKQGSKSINTATSPEKKESDILSWENPQPQRLVTSHSHSEPDHQSKTDVSITRQEKGTCVKDTTSWINPMPPRPERQARSSRRSESEKRDKETTSNNTELSDKTESCHDDVDSMVVGTKMTTDAKATCRPVVDGDPEVGTEKASDTKATCGETLLEQTLDGKEEEIVEESASKERTTGDRSEDLKFVAIEDYPEVEVDAAEESKTGQDRESTDTSESDECELVEETVRADTNIDPSHETSTNTADTGVLAETIEDQTNQITDQDCEPNSIPIVTIELDPSETEKPADGDRQFDKGLELYKGGEKPADGDAYLDKDPETDMDSGKSADTYRTLNNNLDMETEKSADVLRKSDKDSESDVGDTGMKRCDVDKEPSSTLKPENSDHGEVGSVLDASTDSSISFTSCSNPADTEEAANTAEDDREPSLVPLIATDNIQSSLAPTPDRDPNSSYDTDSDVWVEAIEEMDMTSEDDKGTESKVEGSVNSFQVSSSDKANEETEKPPAEEINVSEICDPEYKSEQVPETISKQSSSVKQIEKERWLDPVAVIFGGEDIDLSKSAAVEDDTDFKVVDMRQKRELMHCEKLDIPESVKELSEPVAEAGKEIVINPQENVQLEKHADVKETGELLEASKPEAQKPSKLDLFLSSLLGFSQEKTGLEPVNVRDKLNPLKPCDASAGKAESVRDVGKVETFRDSEKVGAVRESQGPRLVALVDYSSSEESCDEEPPVSKKGNTVPVMETLDVQTSASQSLLYPTQDADTDRGRSASPEPETAHAGDPKLAHLSSSEHSRSVSPVISVIFSDKSQSDSSTPSSPRKIRKKKHKIQPTPFFHDEVKVQLKSDKWKNFEPEKQIIETESHRLKNIDDKEMSKDNIEEKNCEHAMTQTEGKDFGTVLKGMAEPEDGYVIVKANGHYKCSENTSVLRPLGHKHTSDKSTMVDIPEEPTADLMFSLFPEVAEAHLNEVLEVCHGDVTMALDLMLEWGVTTPITPHDKRHLSKKTAGQKSLDSVDSHGQIELKSPPRLVDICMKLFSYNKAATQNIEQQIINSSEQRLQRIESSEYLRLRSISVENVKSSPTDMTFPSNISLSDFTPSTQAGFLPGNTASETWSSESSATSSERGSVSDLSQTLSEASRREKVARNEREAYRSSIGGRPGLSKSPAHHVETEGNLTLLLPASLVRSLEQMFGSLPLSDQGEANRTVELDQLTAYHLYQCVARSSHKQPPPSNEDKLRQLREDEALAQWLQGEEEVDRTLRSITSTEPVVENPQSYAATTLPHPLSPMQISVDSQKSSLHFRPWGQPVNLKDIMDEEMMQQQNQKRQAKLLEARGDHIAIATRLKREKLQQHFPGVDERVLEEIFQANGYCLETTVRVLESSLGGKRPVSHKLTMSAADSSALADDAFTLEAVKQLSLQDMKGKAEEKEEFQRVDAFEQPDQDYQELRQEALLHHYMRKECFQKAHEAHRRGMRDVATFYSRQGHTHFEKMKEANMRASERLLETRNEKLDQDMTLDLHGFHVEEAIAVMKRVIEEKEKEFQQKPVHNRQVLYVITGRGRHSQRGVAKLRPAVLAHLEATGYRYTESKPGLVKVFLHPS